MSRLRAASQMASTISSTRLSPAWYPWVAELPVRCSSSVRASVTSAVMAGSFGIT